jgi:DNA polymerase-1
LEKELVERKLDTLFRTLELPLLPVLARMERQGIYLDIPQLQATGEFINQEIDSCVKVIYEMAGETFNLNSPKQLSHILFDKMGIHPPKKTATGHSTNADVLESLKNAYPFAGKVLEYRSLEKLRSTYIETLPGDVNTKSQRIHCTFNQSVASTGRLSCQDPNLQNIPVRTEDGRRIRQAFRPQKEGWSYLSADYSQIELRLLAHLSEDPTLLHAFNHGEDIHAYTASCIYDIPLDAVTNEQRYSAKAVNFGIVYGQGPWGLAEQLGIGKKEAAAFIDVYFKRYPRVKEFIEECKAKARATGKAVTMTGRERAIAEINSKNAQIRAAAERLAINTPLQGTAADLIKIAMLKIDALLLKERCLGYMILQIHDELIFELPDFEQIHLQFEIQQAMQSVMKLKVPLIVNIGVGKNWKEC